MTSRVFNLALSVGIVFSLGAGAVYGLELSIYDIQTNTSDGDASIYNGQIHNCDGGVVTHIWAGFNYRVYLQDPAHPTWGAIVVKDGEGGELANNVGVGDWVSFDNIFIDEFRGTTFLQYRRSQAPDVTFTVESTGNLVPDPTVLTVSDLIVPVNHPASEPYESMAVTLQNVIVGRKDLGKASDNYELLQSGAIAWGTDYMNVDAGAPYDPRIISGRIVLSITGMVEQYTYTGWDYYQLNTRSAADIDANGAIPAVSEWGLVALSLLLLTGGTLALRRIHHSPAWAKRRPYGDVC